MLLLAIDIGNTSVSFGLFDNDDIVARFKCASDKSLAAPDYAMILQRGLVGALPGNIDRPGADITTVCACSVVPGLDAAMEGAVSTTIKRPLLFAGRDLAFGMPVDYERPDELGPDRVVNAVAAYERFKGPVIVVDAGSAITIDYVTVDGRFAGGAIAPGVKMASDVLHKKTARLPFVEVAKPDRVVGRNTAQGIRSGVYWGMIGLVDNIIERMMEEARIDPAIISTGGDGAMMAAHSKHAMEYDESLLLKGLKIISGSGGK